MLDISKMCRVCRDESEILVDLFVDSLLPVNEPNLAVMLSQCSGCRVNRGDGYPQFICADCAGDTRRAFRLRQQSRRSIEYFNQLRAVQPTWMVELQDIDDYVKLENGMKYETGGLAPSQEEVPNAITDAGPSHEDGTMMESLFVELVAPTRSEAPESPENVKIKRRNSEDNKPLIPACDKESWVSVSGDSGSDCSDAKKTPAAKRFRSQSGSSSDNSSTPPIRAMAKEKKGKSFKCPHCKASFDQSNNLKIHIRVHTGIRPYQCTQCPRSFAQKGNLKTHIRVHTGERPFKCTHCSLAFRQVCHLRNHTLTHTEEKPFKCAHCSYAFTQKINLQKHSKSAHKEAKKKPRKRNGVNNTIC